MAFRVPTSSPGRPFRKFAGRHHAQVVAPRDGDRHEGKGGRHPDCECPPSVATGAVVDLNLNGLSGAPIVAGTAVSGGGSYFPTLTSRKGL